MHVHTSQNVEGNVLCDLHLGSMSNQIYSVNAFPPKQLEIATSNFAGAYGIYCRGYWATSRVCHPAKAKIKGGIMNFLAKTSPPKLLYAATSNFADALVRYKGICDGVPPTEV